MRASKQYVGARSRGHLRYNLQPESSLLDHGNISTISHSGTDEASGVYAIGSI